jgi:protein TonB
VSISEQHADVVSSEQLVPPEPAFRSWSRVPVPVPTRSRTSSGLVLTGSVLLHVSLAAFALQAAQSKAAVRAPQRVEIDLAPPPPPPPVPEVKPPPPEVTQPPPPPAAVRPIHSHAQPAQEHRAASAAPPPPASSEFPASDEGELPPAPQAEKTVVAPPAPPPPAPAPPKPAPIVEAKEGANYLKNPRPGYPRLALRQGWEGKVVLRVKVLPNGRVGDATVQSSAGRPVFDEAALDIVKSWTFVPATQSGKPIAGYVAVPFEFRIK